MLKLRRGIVTATDPLMVAVGGEERPAWADRALIGEICEGDELVVNVEAKDLALGSGGFDVVHLNLTRGLAGQDAERARGMKLNYSSLQHSVDPVEALPEDRPGRAIPVLVLSLHGQLAPAAWAASRAGQLHVGYVQTGGGALPGSLSRDVAELRRRGLLWGHVTAGPSYGGDHEAITAIGALRAAAGPLGWDAVIAGPGPGILGSETALGHGGMTALETAHSALALEFETIVAARMSSADPRERHRGLSHHTETVLRMLLGGVRVPGPASDPVALDLLRDACEERHEVLPVEAPLDEYARSGLPAAHMGRPIEEDPLFFAAALSAGGALASTSVVREAA